MAKISVICKNEKCKKEFICDTDGDKEEAFKFPGSQIVIIERCPHCNYNNRIVAPSPEG